MRWSNKLCSIPPSRLSRPWYWSSRSLCPGTGVSFASLPKGARNGESLSPMLSSFRVRLRARQLKGRTRPLSCQFLRQRSTTSILRDPALLLKVCAMFSEVLAAVLWDASRPWLPGVDVRPDRCGLPPMPFIAKEVYGGPQRFKCAHKFAAVQAWWTSGF